MPEAWKVNADLNESIRLTRSREELRSAHIYHLVKPISIPIESLRLQTMKFSAGDIVKASLPSHRDFVFQDLIGYLQEVGIKRGTNVNFNQVMASSSSCWYLHHFGFKKCHKNRFV